jgi:hypothetical protein
LLAEVLTIRAHRDHADSTAATGTSCNPEPVVRQVIPNALQRPGPPPIRRPPPNYPGI